MGTIIRPVRAGENARVAGVTSARYRPVQPEPMGSGFLFPFTIINTRISPFPDLPGEGEGVL